MSCNEGQFDVVEVFNLNAQHVNGMTHFDLVKLGTFTRYSRVDTREESFTHFQIRHF